MTTPDAPAGPVTVFLLDDHELLRCGLRDTLATAGGFVVVGESGSAREAVQRILALRPQVMLLDVQLPDGSGVDVCRRVRDVAPDVKGLVVTTYDDDDARLAATVAGASGFVLKQIDPRELVRTVRRVAAGETVMQAGERSRAVRRTADEPYGVLDRLTGQERRILDLIAEGLTNRQIGERLGIGEKTVKNYVTSLLLKLGFTRRTQAAVFITRVRR
jgi:DNA-binding NarL/FixJ family response regulator